MRPELQKRLLRVASAVEKLAASYNKHGGPGAASDFLHTHHRPLYVSINKLAKSTDAQLSKLVSEYERAVDNTPEGTPADSVSTQELNEIAYEHLLDAMARSGSL